MVGGDRRLAAGDASLVQWGEQLVRVISWPGRARPFPETMPALAEPRWTETGPHGTLTTMPEGPGAVEAGETSASRCRHPRGPAVMLVGLSLATSECA